MIHFLETTIAMLAVAAVVLFVATAICGGGKEGE